MSQSKAGSQNQQSGKAGKPAKPAKDDEADANATTGSRSKKAVQARTAA